MRTTLAALAVFLAGPASAATVTFSGTVASTETILTTFDPSGDATVISDTVANGGGEWADTFFSRPYGSAGFLGDLTLGGAGSALAITKTGAEGTSSYQDYGSGGWDWGSADIFEHNGGSVGGVIMTEVGYMDGDGNGYSREVIYTLTGPSISVPEPASWAMMLIGFGLMGAMVRRKRRVHEPG